jgi:hypothetical protein
MAQFIVAALNRAALRTATVLLVSGMAVACLMVDANAQNAQPVIPISPGTMSGTAPAPVTIPAATATTVVAASSLFKHVCIINTGTNQAWWSYGTAAASPATANSFPLNAAAVAGQQGGGFCWDSGPVPTNGVNVFSTSGTTIVVETGS